MLSVYKVEDSDKWDSIVKSFKDYDVYWLSGYVKAFQIHGDGEPLLFYYDDGNVRGINVVMKRDIADDIHFKDVLPSNLYYDFATPYGYGGWIIEGNTRKDILFSEYDKWCKDNNIVCEFVRYHPVIMNYDSVRDYYDVIELGNTVSMDLSSPNVIWSNITSKNRNVIRKAIKNGVKIYTSRNPEIFKKFIEIYNKTMDKDSATDYYYFEPEFYDSILNDLSHNAQIFYAQLEDGTIIAASIMMEVNGKMNYHLSGSVREYQHLAPTNLLLYEAALWGSANGYKTLHLGGGVGSGEDSLFKFKRSFYRGDLLNFCIGKKLYNEEVYNKLVRVRKKESDFDDSSKFFPLYKS